MNGSALAAELGQRSRQRHHRCLVLGRGRRDRDRRDARWRQQSAGRLPVTFYKGTEQLPDFEDYAMKNRTYRYFTANRCMGSGMD